MANAPKLDPKYCFFKLKLARSAIHRWGVYAAEPIPANRKVIEYSGALVSRREAKRRAEASEHTYLFTVNDYWSRDGADGGSGAEYINHSCSPNIRAAVVKKHVLYFSKRAIRKGEELTVDYHFGPDVERVVCTCGAPNCRGTINEYD